MLTFFNGEIDVFQRDYIQEMVDDVFDPNVIPFSLLETMYQTFGFPTTNDRLDIDGLLFELDGFAIPPVIRFYAIDKDSGSTDLDSNLTFELRGPVTESSVQSDLTVKRFELLTRLNGFLSMERTVSRVHFQHCLMTWLNKFSVEECADPIRFVIDDPVKEIHPLTGNETTLTKYSVVFDVAGSHELELSLRIRY